MRKARRRHEESREAEQARLRKEAEDTDRQRQDEINRLQQAQKTLKIDNDELLKKYNI